MYAVLAEDISDADVISAIIKAIKNDLSVTVLKKGYGGAGQLFKQGSEQIRAFRNAKACRKFIVCYDSDGFNAAERKDRIIKEIIRPSGVEANFCALVPIQEIEAWFLSDLSAVKKVFPRFDSTNSVVNPESVLDPKEYLRRNIGKLEPRPKYVNAIHSPQIAAKLNFPLVKAKCKSFEPLFDFVSDGKANVPN